MSKITQHQIPNTNKTLIEVEVDDIYVNDQLDAQIENVLRNLGPAVWSTFSFTDDNQAALKTYSVVSVQNQNIINKQLDNLTNDVLSTLV